MAIRRVPGPMLSQGEGPRTRCARPRTGQYLCRTEGNITTRQFVILRQVGAFSQALQARTAIQPRKGAILSYSPISGLYRVLLPQNPERYKLTLHHNASKQGFVVSISSKSHQSTNKDLRTTTQLLAAQSCCLCLSRNCTIIKC